MTIVSFLLYKLVKVHENLNKERETTAMYIDHIETLDDTIKKLENDFIDSTNCRKIAATIINNERKDLEEKKRKIKELEQQQVQLFSNFMSLHERLLKTEKQHEDYVEEANERLLQTEQELNEHIEKITNMIPQQVPFGTEPNQGTISVYCKICMETKPCERIFNCGHFTCFDCFFQMEDQGNGIRKCPDCNLERIYNPVYLTST